MKQILRAFAALSVFAGGLFAATDKPNVVVIMADDLGWGDVGCNGAKPEAVKTPNIDSIANSGINFTNGYCTSATCSPSRYSFLSGEYAFRKTNTGILPGDANLILDPAKMNLPAVFKKAGYNTAVVGKWHLGMGKDGEKVDWNKKIDYSPNILGFDYSYIFPATNDRQPCVYVENGEVVNLDKNDPIVLDYNKHTMPKPTEAEIKTLRWPNIGQRDSIHNGAWRFGYMKGGKSALWLDENLADDFTAKAVDYIKKNKDRPFFLFFSSNDIHAPHIPHARFVGKSAMGPRGDAILSFDWSVGKIVDALKDAGILDNTILIITSDNGGICIDGNGAFCDGSDKVLGDHKITGDMSGGKYSILEGGTRIPFIVSFPDLMKGTKLEGSKSDAIVSQVDFLASFADMLGVNVPKGSAEDSQNQLDALLGKSKDGREWVLEFTQMKPTVALRMGDYKYIPEKSKEPEGLYNLRNDIGEKNNLIKSDPERVAKMKKTLDKLIGEDSLDVLEEMRTPAKFKKAKKNSK